jgi:hypothetical protein
MPERGEDAEAALGLHLPGEDVHRRVEDDRVEGHRRREHGYGVQEVFKGYISKSIQIFHENLYICRTFFDDFFTQIHTNKMYQ